MPLKIYPIKKKCYIKIRIVSKAWKCQNKIDVLTSFIHRVKWRIKKKIHTKKQEAKELVKRLLYYPGIR